MGDNEGSAFVPSDHSLWLADDIKKRIYEVDPATGVLKRTIQRRAFINAPKLGGGRRRGRNARTTSRRSPTTGGKSALRLLRSLLQFLDARDGLPTDASVGAVQSRVVPASPHGRRLHSCRLEPPPDGKIWVGKGLEIRSFRYATGTAGRPVQRHGVHGILGMDFSSDGADLFVTVNSERLIRVDWSTRTVVSGWTFDLTPSASWMLGP